MLLTCLVSITSSIFLSAQPGKCKSSKTIIGIFRSALNTQLLFQTRGLLGFWLVLLKQVQKILAWDFKLAFNFKVSIIYLAFHWWLGWWRATEVIKSSWRAGCQKRCRPNIQGTASSSSGACHLQKVGPEKMHVTKGLFWMAPRHPRR